MNADIKKGLSKIQDSVERARLFALIAHRDQTYGGQPYGVHLNAVALTLARFGHDGKMMQAAAWLHDTLEDTEAKPEDVIELFGNPVYDIVYAVTNEPGKNRKERSRKTYPKIAANGYAQALKLADRIANMENCILTDNSRLDMYRKEYPDFKKALDAGEQHQLMWKWLDFLSR